MRVKGIPKTTPITLLPVSSALAMKEVHVTSLRSDVVLSIVPERRGRKRHAA